MLVLGMVLFVLPVEAVDNQNSPQETTKIDTSQKQVEVNAAAKTVKKRTYKSTSTKYKTVRAQKIRTYKRSYAYKRYTKAYSRLTYAYKLVKVGKRWKRVRYVVRTTSTKPVAAATTTTSSSYRVTQGNPVITAEYVEADARCSCSLYTDYNIYHGKYVNYCPHCKKSGILSYTNLQGCPEGMFYCDMRIGGCDADYCIVHGKEHVNNNPKYLTPA